MYPHPSTPSAPPVPGSVLRFDVDLRFSHVTVQTGRPKAWFPKEHAFQFLGWATVVQSDPAGWRAGIEPILLVEGQVVPASLIGAALGLRGDERAVVTAIVPAATQ